MVQPTRGRVSTPCRENWWAGSWLRTLGGPSNSIGAPGQPLITGEDDAGSILRLPLDGSDADGVGDETAVGRVLAPVPIRFHPVVPLRDPLEKMLRGEGVLAVTDQAIEKLVVAYR